MSLSVSTTPAICDEAEVEANTADPSDHVRLAGNALFCAHCGAVYRVTLPASMWEFSALTSKFLDDHKGCEVGEQGVACSMCFAFGHKEDACPALSYGQDLKKWFHGPDTGLSSRTIFRKLSGKQWRGEFDYDTTPADPADFGRCHRLLHSFTGWRARIVEMADVPGWAGLVAAWDELEALYLEELPSGQCPKLYARMREIEANQ